MVGSQWCPNGYRYFRVRCGSYRSLLCDVLCTWSASSTSTSSCEKYLAHSAGIRCRLSVWSCWRPCADSAGGADSADARHGDSAACQATVGSAQSAAHSTYRVPGGTHLQPQLVAAVGILGRAEFRQQGRHRVQPTLRSRERRRRHHGARGGGKGRGGGCAIIRFALHSLAYRPPSVGLCIL